MTDHMTTHDAVSLSDTGAARRDAMLGDLLSYQHRVRRNRRVRRIAAVVLAPALVVIAAVMLSRLGDADPEAGPIIAGGTEAPSPDLRQFRWAQIVRVGAASLEPYTAEPPPIVERIDDRELLRLLEEMGRPAGLIRVAGQTRLTAAVVDEEIGR